jgi:hypothetical protein
MPGISDALADVHNLKSGDDLYIHILQKTMMLIVLLCHVRTKVCRSPDASPTKTNANSPTNKNQV